MTRPPKSTSTACNKLESYCDFLESKISTQEKEKEILANKISDLSMELVNEKLKNSKPFTVHNPPIPCNNMPGFIGKCSHCQTPVCHYCGKCTNPSCRIFGCSGGK